MRWASGIMKKISARRSPWAARTVRMNSRVVGMCSSVILQQTKSAAVSTHFSV